MLGIAGAPAQANDEAVSAACSGGNEQMQDDFPQAVNGNAELAKLLKDLAPEVRETVCQFLREYQQLSEAQREKVLRLGEALLQEARSELLGHVREA
jgi:hypothetical protein